MIVALLALAATPIASTPALGTAAAQCRPHEPGPAIVVTVEGLKDRAGNLRAEVYPAATDHVPEMVTLVQKMMEHGHAYKAEDGSIYFSIASFPKYGELSHMNLEELKSGARVASDEYEKDSVSDFALWKAWDEQDGDVFWETALGKGRPGRSEVGAASWPMVLVS